MKHYAVRNLKTRKFNRKGKVVQYFSDKQDAKALRKELNGTNKDNEELFMTGWTVSAQEMGAAA